MPALRHSALDAEELAALVTGPDRGALVTFVGSVRDHHAGRRVLSLAYSAYEPMVETLCGQITAEAEARWPVRVALAHRIGELKIGDAAVMVAVAGAHRDEAFAACRWLIEEVKAKLPIWKRERYADGTEAWVDPTAPGGTEPTAHGPRRIDP